MTEIGGNTFIILGIIVCAVSYFSELWFFTIIGGAFILFGLYKLAFKKHAHKTTTMQGHPSAQRIQQNIPSGSHEIRCTTCSIKMHPLYNFCPKCGKRVR